MRSPGSAQLGPGCKVGHHGELFYQGRGEEGALLTGPLKCSATAAESQPETQLRPPRMVLTCKLQPRCPALSWVPWVSVLSLPLQPLCGAYPPGGWPGAPTRGSWVSVPSLGLCSACVCVLIP